MFVVVGEVASGKTHGIVEMSAKTGAVIVCHSFHHMFYCMALARELKLAIPNPVMFDELSSGKRLHLKDHYLIDDVDMVLGRLLKTGKIDGVTMTGKIYSRKEIEANEV